MPVAKLSLMDRIKLYFKRMSCYHAQGPTLATGEDKYLVSECTKCGKYVLFTKQGVYVPRLSHPKGEIFSLCLK